MSRLFAAAQREVEAAVRAVAPAVDGTKHALYIGGGLCRLDVHGLKVPQTKALAKTGFSFAKEEPALRLEIWNYIWQNSRLFEARSLALGHYADNKKLALADIWPVLREWAQTLDNWAHSDGLSSVYARHLEAAPKEVLPVLQAWSESDNLWLRRQSLVSLLYYASSRSKTPSFAVMAKLVERQLRDPEHYVQRGVGWTLREMGHVYPAETLRFLVKHAEEFSAVAFSAATEKLAKTDKERLKTARSKARS